MFRSPSPTAIEERELLLVYVYVVYAGAVKKVMKQFQGGLGMPNSVAKLSTSKRNSGAAQGSKLLSSPGLVSHTVSESSPRLRK